MPKILRTSAIVCGCNAFLLLGNPALAATNETSSFIIKNDWGARDESPQNSLPQSSVIAMTLRRDGYLWLGTLNGLVRFDGNQFTVFDEHNVPGLNSSRIVHLFEDSRTNLWIGTDSAGIALLRPDGNVRSLKIGSTTSAGRLVSACEDSGSAVWLYTADGQLCRYRHEKGRVDVFEFGAQYPSLCRKLAADQSTLWVGVDWGLFGIGPTAGLAPEELPVQQMIPVLGTNRLDFLLASERGGFWRLGEGRIEYWTTNRVNRSLGAYPWKKNTHVSAACEDRNGNLVVGTYSFGLTGDVNDGVYWFGADGRVAHIWHEQGLSHDGILSLVVDREGSLWVGTDGGGLNRVKRNPFEVPREARGLIHSIADDQNGGLWLGSGGRVTHFKDGRAENYEAAADGRNFYVSALFVDKRQRVWAGTLGGGLFQFGTNGFAQAWSAPLLASNVFAIHQDRSGKLWFGTDRGLVSWNGNDWRQSTMNDGISGNVVRAIADDRDGNLWIGTDGSGLNCLREGRLTIFHKTNGLPSEKISCLLADSDGVLWIGTDGGGLARLQNGKCNTYSRDNGLASNSIGYLLDGDDGSLWIGSNLGLMRVQKKALNDFGNGTTPFVFCRTYKESDGLPASECTQGSQPAAIRASDGKIWFPTINGSAGVNPAQLKPNPFPPPIAIESVVLESRLQNSNLLRANDSRDLIIRPGQERLEIHYTSLNPGEARRTHFKYRMEGHEAAWTDAGNSRVARYPKLPPGNYRFHVVAANEDGVWNEAGASLTITVLPPFWKTWWFRTLIGIAFTAFVVGIVYFISTQKLQRQLERLRQQEALEKERSRIARDLHDQLGANLTQVALLGEMVESDKNLPDEVEDHAKQISETARETTRALDEIVWAANPLNDTLEGLINYACKYAQEFLTVVGLRYRLNVPTDLPIAAIPPEVRHNVFLAFKEALTNVARHAQATEVCVRLLLNPDSFILEIEDDGRGFIATDEKPNRSGLRNMHKRMEDLQGEFSITPRTGGGTIVRLTAPFEKTNRT